ncbi:hypothetical protein FKP32DRAFT_1267671 [Trametes sanguinea]|nr:hypothetical protein FKP32DRAFT_1267671 [Trametes sanguinea]
MATARGRVGCPTMGMQRTTHLRTHDIPEHRRQSLRGDISAKPNLTHPQRCRIGQLEILSRTSSLQRRSFRQKPEKHARFCSPRLRGVCALSRSGYTPHVSVRPFHECLVPRLAPRAAAHDTVHLAPRTESTGLVHFAPYYTCAARRRRRSCHGPSTSNAMSRCNTVEQAEPEPARSLIMARWQHKSHGYGRRRS